TRLGTVNPTPAALVDGGLVGHHGGPLIDDQLRTRSEEGPRERKVAAPHRVELQRSEIAKRELDADARLCRLHADHFLEVRRVPLRPNAQANCNFVRAVIEYFDAPRKQRDFAVAAEVRA